MKHVHEHAAPARPALWLAGLYLLSRLCFYAAGVRFDLKPIDSSWQILDPALLRHDLLESVLYMPGQPPLYNLMLGGLLKLGHEDAALRLLFRGVYSAMALAAVLLLYVLVTRLTRSRRLGFAVALIFMLTPALALYEVIPYYTLPVLALLGAIAWLFAACMDDFNRWRALALFLAMAVLIYTRALFQLEWFIVLVAYTALVLPGRRRAVLLAASVPLVLILALYAKNAIVTGHFATSDWLGMSLSKLTTRQLDDTERQRLVDAGQLSPMALKNAPFKAPDAYPYFFAHTPATGIAVLDQRLKSTGHVNFNHLAYARVSEQALADALATIRVHPGVYLRTIGTAWLEFWRPASDYPFLTDNRAAVEPYSRAFSLLLAGQPRYPQTPRFDLEPGQIGRFIAAGYGLVVAFGLVLCLRCVWRAQVSASDATLIFLWLNILYVSVIGNALEVDENQRFRFAINPLIAAMLAVLAQRAWLGLRGREVPD